uniref:Uncharacterized protein n=1 Tax=Branchiostoma floridae TaxID=7739 RepID=C3Z2F2_BRAFL|eukprot:XP_002597191.1 hypothetical protein BRAFLDRAFT_66318 [Branchiostoma floridae]
MEKGAMGFPRCVNFPPEVSKACLKGFTYPCTLGHLQPPFAIFVKNGEKRRHVPSTARFPEISVTENMHYQRNPQGAYQPEDMPHGHEIDNGQTPQTPTTNAYAQINEEDEYNPQHHTYWEIKEEDVNCEIKDKDASSGRNQNPISPLSSFPEIFVTENTHYQRNPQGAPQYENMPHDQDHEIDNEQTPQKATTNAYAHIKEEVEYNPQHHTNQEIKDEDTVSGQGAQDTSSSETISRPKNLEGGFTSDDGQTEDSSHAYENDEVL